HEHYIHIDPSDLIFIWLCTQRFGRRESDIPPGPSTSPLLTRWAREFGDIYSLKLFNKTLVVLSSPEAVKNVLDKQGAVTGGRPPVYALGLLNDFMSMILSGMDTGIWKRGRKAIHTFLTPQALDNYKHTQRLEYVQLLYDAIHRPNKIVEHIKRTTASTMIMLVYGSRCATIHIANDLADFSAHPPIDLFPFLKYVPERWARWKVLCMTAKRMRQDMHAKLLGDCERRISSGMAPRCYIEEVLQSKEELRMVKKEIMFAILALLNFPDAQKKAQEEIDMVIQADRLPALEDFESLPYVQALIKEVHRFRTVLPLGFPHVAMEDVMYNGHRIPKDTMIFLNAWAIFHDPEYFDDPESFNPGRYLTSEFGTKAGVDTSVFRNNFGFGAGRRICPGEHMGMQSSAQIAMNLLWAFSFTKDTSGTGGIDLECYGKPGMELTPIPFTCKIEIRSSERRLVIEEAYARALNIWEHGI
ncbi:putative cytochrome P450 monooxygenase, partial [Cyathus striatus]